MGQGVENILNVLYSKVEEWCFSPKILSDDVFCFMENSKASFQLCKKKQQQKKNNTYKACPSHSTPPQEATHQTLQPIMKNGNCKLCDTQFFVSLVDSVLKLDLQSHILHLQHREQCQSHL